MVVANIESSLLRWHAAPSAVHASAGALADLPSCGGAPADAWTADGAACCAANRAEHPNATAGLRECDALWARDGATGDPPPVPPGVWENVWGPSMVIT